MNLDSLRRDIDALDAKILALLTTRMEKAILTKKFKKQTKDSARESDVLNNVRNSSRFLVEARFSLELYEKILSESKRLQGLNFTTFGFLGEHGALCEKASGQFRSDAATIPFRDYDELCAAVESSVLDFAIIPMDNAPAEMASHVAIFRNHTKLTIIAEINMPACDCLLSLPETSPGDIRSVWSDQLSLLRCKGFLKKNGYKASDYPDASQAAKSLAESQTPAVGVIAGRSCAELYGLKIIAEDIQDLPDKGMRFIVLGSPKEDPEGDKGNEV